MRERIIIVFIAVAIGLLITTLLFFLYQQTKITPNKSQGYGTENSAPKTNPKETLLTVDSPQANSISEKRTIQIKGQTNPQNTLVVSTNQEDVVTKPANDGKFSITITIDTGANRIVTRAIEPNGEETVDTRVITYSTEDF